LIYHGKRSRVDVLLPLWRHKAAKPVPKNFRKKLYVM
jgi:hypothetical protein